VTLPDGTASAARLWDCAEVQRSVQARVSLQYHRRSEQAWPPSGTIWFWCRRMPHSQHETRAARRARGEPGVRALGSRSLIMGHRAFLEADSG
jgi:hypothetical protein